MRIVYVTYLETCTLTAQTARTKSRETTLVSNLCKRVGLVHKLGERVSSKERVDNARNSLGIDKVCRLEHLIVTNVHTLTNGATHTSKTYGELVRQLLTYCAHAAVRKVVDIVNCSVRVNQLYEILDNLYDVFLGKDTNIHVCIQTKFLVNSVTAHVAKIVAFVREEEVEDYLTCTCIIGRVCIAKLTIDVVYGLLFRVAWVLGKRVEDNRKLRSSFLILVKKNC